MAVKVLRIEAIVEAIQVSRTTIWRMVKKGAFPPPIKLSSRAVGWRESEVEAWIESRTAAGTEAE